MSSAFSTAIRKTLQKSWLSNKGLSQVLLPLSRLTEYFVQKKRQSYLSGQKKSYKAPVPLIVVGNIFIGGTGKTPLTLALVEALKSYGYTPGLISRGYGIKLGKTARFADLSLTPAVLPEGADTYSISQFIGDEPSLLAQKAPIAVHPNRQKAIECLLSQRPDVNVIISDDGLQHYAMARDIEIVVQDSRGLGNGYMLPAGPLREPSSRLKSVDFIVTNDAHLFQQYPVDESQVGSPLLNKTDTATKTSPSLIPPQTTLTEPAKTHHTHKTPGALTNKTLQQTSLQTSPSRIYMQLALIEFEHLQTGERLSLANFQEKFASSAISAIAGIGHPERFFNSLEQAGFTLSYTEAFADHYVFALKDFHQHAPYIMLMTSKDGIKCKPFAQKNWWVAHVKAQFKPDHFFEDIHQKLQQLMP